MGAVLFTSVANISTIQWKEKVPNDVSVGVKFKSVFRFQQNRRNILFSLHIWWTVKKNRSLCVCMCVFQVLTYNQSWWHWGPSLEVLSCFWDPGVLWSTTLLFVLTPRCYACVLSAPHLQKKGPCKQPPSHISGWMEGPSSLDAPHMYRDGVQHPFFPITAET